MGKPKLIAIVGPTASGKTALALHLARALSAHGGAEIVSADSRQIYRGMDIGTAKPTLAEQRAVPHHLIDIRNPDTDYTAAEYKHDAIAAINDILTRGKVPLLAGGTGLYVRAVVENLDIPPVAPDPKLRAQIEEEIRRDGLAVVFDRLVALDPEAEYVVDPQNPRRVVRAMEVTLATGAPFTAQRTKADPLFNTLLLGRAIPAPELRERIDHRVDTMVDAGLVEEVKHLMKTYAPDLPAFDAIGYREVINALQGTITFAEATAQIKINTWRFAKRQMTWFKKEQGIQWISSADEAIAAARAFLEK